MTNGVIDGPKLLARIPFTVGERRKLLAYYHRREEDGQLYTSKRALIDVLTQRERDGKPALGAFPDNAKVCVETGCISLLIFGGDS